MKSLSLVMVPFIAAMALVFGGWYVYLGIAAARKGNLPGAAFAIVFGIAGIALGLALFRARRLLRSNLQSRSDATR